LAEKVRNMAIKREQQAATAANPMVAQELSATARSYRALADALAKSPEVLLDRAAGGTATKLENKI
jgi:hypothetical protein